jgi:uncharacterized protein
MTSPDGGVVDQLWRFPVKSMQGESVASVEVTERGVAGDRLWALVDVSDGKVVSAKNPRKWARVLELSAAYVDEAEGAAAPPVAVTLPDGTVVRSDVTDDDASGVLSRFLGREVRLTASVPEVPVMEETWPDDVEGLAPDSFIESTRIPTDDDDTVSDIRMAMAAPPGTFFDLASLHLLTTSTLASLRAAHPDGDFDVRRYRPNVVVATSGGGFVENDWVGRAVTLGSAGAATAISMATMRCVMTTMAQPGLVRDLSLLQTIARTNRLSMLGGQWACAGAYGSVAGVGTVRVGDPVSVSAPA